jgi:uncharacterized protein
LRRVIVATEQNVFMADTLDKALAGALTGQESSVTPGTEGGGGEPVASGDMQALVQQANDAYQRSQDALARGDWAAYGQAQAELASILHQMETLTGGQATPTANQRIVATPAP